VPPFVAPTSPHLIKLIQGLRRRSTLPGEARKLADRDLVRLAAELDSSLQQRVPVPADEPPPRRVAVAFAMALHSQPQFTAILGEPVRSGAEDPGEPVRRMPDAVPVPTTDLIERVLGLPAWEVDDLREEVDRRAGTVFKRDRTVSWMWAWAGLPKAGANTLAAALFPGVDLGSVSLVRRGGHIFLMSRSVKAPRAALWLPWLDKGLLGPSAFVPAQVDDVLRRRIGRGVGSEAEETSQLLSSMVVMVPRSDARAFLQLDQWRIHGRATVTDLGADYCAGTWLKSPLDPHGGDWRNWLLQDEDGTLAVRGTVTKVFDRLAMPRASAMMRQVYAAIVSTVDAEGVSGPGTIHADDLDIYDLETHMRAVLEPVFQWASNIETHQAIADAYELPLEEVATHLSGLEQVWRDHAARSWWGLDEKTPSILTITTPHVVLLQNSLRRLMRRDPAGDWLHGDMVLLFAAHYLREARLERLWMQQLSDVASEETVLPPPEDIPGRWFWSTWLRLLEAMDQESTLAS
jgi:hypothetical protein